MFVRTTRGWCPICLGCTPSNLWVEQKVERQVVPIHFWVSCHCFVIQWKFREELGISSQVSKNTVECLQQKNTVIHWSVTPKNSSVQFWGGWSWSCESIDAPYQHSSLCLRHLGVPCLTPMFRPWLQLSPFCKTNTTGRDVVRSWSSCHGMYTHRCQRR